MLNYPPSRRWSPLLVLLLCAWNAAAEPVPDKEIYGTDDRVEVFQETNPFIAGLARSVCALIHVENLQQNADGTYTLLARDNTIGGNGDTEYFMCPDEAFAEQQWTAFCTGFVVGADLLATAGHCIEYTGVGEYRAVFGWEMVDAVTPVTVVPGERVYRVVEVVHSALNYARDHAILRLDRVVTVPGAVPLAVRRAGKIAEGTRVGVIGHPMGLPKKIAFGPDTRVYGNARPFVFYANFDASAGNSGSPVFNQATGLVEGIYVHSDVPDFFIDGDCFRLNRVGNNEAGQGVMRSTTFAQHIPGGEGGPVKRFPICGAGGEATAAFTGDAVWLMMVCLILFGRASSTGERI